MAQLLSLTAANVNKLPLATAGQVHYRDDKLQGFGLRVGTSAKAYYVEKRVDGRTVRHTLGLHGHLTADEARKLARIKLGKMTEGVDLNAVDRANAHARSADKSRREAAAQHTLAKLCDCYVDHLRKQEKQSATDAAGLFERHVKGTEAAAKPAKELTTKEAAAIVRVVSQTGHKRTAAKLRAYLRAAYALAQNAEDDTEAPAEFIAFNIEANPVAGTKPIKGNAIEARRVKLSEEELGETVRLLRSKRAVQYDDALAAMELSLELGGQRLAQVLRLTAADVDMDASTVLLQDPKGRRSTPRPHLLPLTETAARLMQQILDTRRADWLFGDKKARTDPNTVARKGVALLAEAQATVAKRSKSKSQANKLEPRDLRRTAETMLAAMGISKDMRAQLLSHGIAGVQAKHYDMHEYMDEKRRALGAWSDHLHTLAERKRAPSNVKAIRAAR